MGPNIVRTIHHRRSRCLVLSRQIGLAASACFYLSALANRRVAAPRLFADAGCGRRSHCFLVEARRSSGTSVFCCRLFRSFTFSGARFLRRLFLSIFVCCRPPAVPGQYGSAGLGRNWNCGGGRFSCQTSGFSEIGFWRRDIVHAGRADLESSGHLSRPRNTLVCDTRQESELLDGAEQRRRRFLAKRATLQRTCTLKKGLGIESQQCCSREQFWLRALVNGQGGRGLFASPKSDRNRSDLSAALQQYRFGSAAKRTTGTIACLSG